MAEPPGGSPFLNTPPLDDESTSFSGLLAVGGKWELRLSKQATPKQLIHIKKYFDVVAKTPADEDDDPKPDAG